MLDKELFELCKEVYKLTKWEYTKEYYDVKWGEVWTISTQITSRGDDKVSKAIPLYTSDFLLDKLPMKEDPPVKVGSHAVLQKWSGGNWGAMWQPAFRRKYIHVVADTPLKALLKLVIALDDAGVKL